MAFWIVLDMFGLSCLSWLESAGACRDLVGYASTRAMYSSPICAAFHLYVSVFTMRVCQVQLWCGSDVIASDHLEIQ